MKPSDADLITEMLYRYAADPATWDSLVDVLDDQGRDAPSGDEALEYDRAVDIARLSSRPGEGPHDQPWRADFGWIVVAAGGKVLVCNPLAATVMAGGLGRAEVNRTLDFHSPANAEAARLALEQVRGGTGQVVLRLERPGGEGPCFAYATPAASVVARLGGAGSRGTGLTGVVALVFPAPDAASRLWLEVQQSFGLTEAEVRLARKLREGLSLQQAADNLGVKINTVRNQLRAIFDKMGLQRQSDLVRTLTELSAVAGALDVQASVTDLSRVLADAPPVRVLTLKDRRRIGYRDYGDPSGKPLLWFHEGLGSSLLPPGAQAIAREHGLRIVTPERPGFGQSDPLSDYRFEVIAQEVVELCDNLGLGTVSLGAVMSGAPSALHTAARLGARAEVLLLCSPRTPRPLGPARSQSLMMSMRARMEANPWVVDAVYAVLRLRRSHAQTRESVRRGASYAPGDRAYVEAHPAVVDFIWAYMGEAMARSSRGPADELKAFQRHRGKPAPDLRSPVIVWQGAEDTLTSLPDVLEHLGSHAAEVRVFEGVGHMLALKHWREIMARVAQGPVST
ncbi:LuxR C-terminal-related transcriptional regulator [Phenylobacterium sp.]|uniref:LuxR C-terminal-related transcriptional regulator n=1 Tax=Phenylobacterium sp. TaxID=1871053 RepID=UPI00286C9893|nr:LuxR C-terminal-related transcriptional regulator [Phenylobacterium sp.]